MYPGNTIFADTRNTSSPRLVKVDIPGNVVWRYQISADVVEGSDSAKGLDSEQLASPSSRSMCYTDCFITVPIGIPWVATRRIPSGNASNRAISKAITAHLSQVSDWGPATPPATGEAARTQGSPSTHPSAAGEWPPPRRGLQGAPQSHKLESSPHGPKLCWLPRNLAVSHSLVTIGGH